MNDQKTVKPYGTSGSKKEEVRDMFDNIAGTYDFLNHALSFNIDRIWRKRAVNALSPYSPKSILDVATGTGDLAIAASKLNPDEIVGVDISQKMLAVGTQKMAKKGLDRMITLQLADSENLPFENERFDAVMVAFGVRNFENLEKGISEMYRVIKPGGILVVLEFANPHPPVINWLYQLYFRHLLPLSGKLVSKDLSAYRYLPESVAAFPKWESFTRVLLDAGFGKADYRSLTFGIAGLYTGRK